MSTKPDKVWVHNDELDATSVVIAESLPVWRNLGWYPIDPPVVEAEDEGELAAEPAETAPAVAPTVTSSVKKEKVPQGQLEITGEVGAPE